MMKITATLLILSSVLHVKAYQGEFHREIHLTVCSDTDDVFYSKDVHDLDGELLAYSDCELNMKMVEPQPPFIDHITFGEEAECSFKSCQANLKEMRKALKNPPVRQEEPYSRIYPKDYAQLGVANVLFCHVTGFYPAPVNVTWSRNNLPLTDNITTTVPQLNKDGTYYQFSSVKFTPEQGDVYSCTVNHQSLSSPETRWWDVDEGIPAQPMDPDVFCWVGVGLGLLGVAMGIFFIIKGNKCN